MHDLLYSLVPLCAHVSSYWACYIYVGVIALQVTVISLILGSLFYKLPTTFDGARTFFGAAFMSVLFLSFGGFPQLPLTIAMKK